MNNQFELFPEADAGKDASGPIMMPCVSLWQPWASFIACGLKGAETRSWPAPASIMGRRIAIHAALTSKGMLEAMRLPELWAARQKHLPKDLPLGMIVATAVVEASIPTERLHPDIYGNYGPGRFGWMLADIKALEKPIPAKGRQGIFMVPIPT